MDFPLCLVDVRDVAEAHLLALEAAEASGERFILSGTPQCMYASDLAPTMRALFPTFPCPVRASPPPRLRAVIKLVLRVPLVRGLLAGEFGRLYFLRDGVAFDNPGARGCHPPHAEPGAALPERRHALCGRARQRGAPPRTVT